MFQYCILNLKDYFELAYRAHRPFQTAEKSVLNVEDSDYLRFSWTNTSLSDFLFHLAGLTTYGVKQNSAHEVDAVSGDSSSLRMEMGKSSTISSISCLGHLNKYLFPYS